MKYRDFFIYFFLMAIKQEKKVQKAIFVPWGWIFSSVQEDGFWYVLSLLSRDPVILAVQMKGDVPLKCTLGLE